MTAELPRLITRSFLIAGLLLALFAFAGGVAAQDMVTYQDYPVYGLSSTINATVDVYLPAGDRDLMSDSWMLGLDVVNRPAVFFIPALSAQVMDRYAQDLTGQGYAVVAMDYRLQSAVQDSLCGLSWLHTFAPIFGIDEHRIVAVGYSHGGQIAALMGALGTQNQMVTGGSAAAPMTFVSAVPIPADEGCPWPVPRGPMVEGVATYDAVLGTPVSLLDSATQLSALPPAGLPRAELVATFDDFAAVPADEWRTLDLHDDIVATVVQSLPAYWLDGSETPHLLMVGEHANSVIHGDNAVYTELLRDLRVPVHLTEMAGCTHDPCALIGEMQPLHTFLAEVFASS